jgi:AcrR family transcriptional regulator
MARAANPNLKSQLVDAATEIFATHGLAAARVSDITDRAGTSKGAFYLHFASKEAAYLEITRAFLDQLLVLMRCQDESMCQAFAEGALERVADADHQFMEFLWEHRRPLALVLDGAPVPHTRDGVTSYAFMQDEFIDSILHHMRESISAHHRAYPQLAGVIDAEFAATMATGIVFMYARRIIRENRPPFGAEQLLAFRALIAAGQPPEVADLLLHSAPHRSAFEPASPSASRSPSSPSSPSSDAP